ncbi:MAG: aminotransferase class IV [Candidatus Kapabacteria bacterium]|nr:aminotransferase class IV [Candidatus Kapabacteria bacterium]
MYLFIESIKVFNGIIYNLALHQERVNRTLSEFYPNTKIDLSEIIIFPMYGQGLYKLRIIYSDKIEKYEFLSYKIYETKTLKIVQADNLKYDFKYLERTAINRLFSARGECDEILIVRNGLITDTSYCNVVLDDGNKLYTPANPLLRGTKREQLLREKRIEPLEILVDDLVDFKRVILINAMIELENCFIDINNVSR